MLLKFRKILFVCLFILLLPSCSTLDVYSRPSGARIFVDDKDIGHTTPYEIRVRDLSLGRHSITVKKEGYQTVKGFNESEFQEFEIGVQVAQIIFSFIPAVLMENLVDDLWKGIKAPRGRRLKMFNLEQDK